MARLPAEIQPGGPGYFELSGALDGSRSLELDRVRAAARNLATVHLDVSRLAAIESDGCAAFLDLMRFMPANGNGLLLTGADHFADLLHEAAHGNPAVEVYWALLLELYRMRGQQSRLRAHGAGVCAGGRRRASHLAVRADAARAASYPA